jgi:putative membrane protein
VARVMLWIVPPSTWAKQVSPSNFPLVLYGIAAVLPLGICVGRGMWLAFVLGTIAMVIPLWLAIRKGPKTAENPSRAKGSLGDIAVAGR